MKQKKNNLMIYGFVVIDSFVIVFISTAKKIGCYFYLFSLFLFVLFVFFSILFYFVLVLVSFHLLSKTLNKKEEEKEDSFNEAFLHIPVLYYGIY